MSSNLPMSVLAFAVYIFAQLHLASASTQFFVRLEHYENYGNLLQVHAHCDSGNLCDPAFSIRVSGSWGQVDTASDCISNANQITFGDKIGSNLTNPLQFTELPSAHPVLIEIFVKECFIDKASDSIGQFHTQLRHLPRPFLFTDRVDYRDSERAPSIEMTPSGNTPLSVKMRVTVWRQCAQFYYGQDCSKFCRPLPSLNCHPETGEMLSCSGSRCRKMITTRGRVGTADTPPSAPVPAVKKTELVDTGVQPAVGKQKSQSGNLSLIVALSCLLALTIIAAAAILVIVRRCGRPKKRPRSSNRALIPPTHSMAVGLRDAESGWDSSAPLQQDFSNACYSVQTRPLPTPGGPVQPCHPDSDVYETPEEPELPQGVPAPPPLPARDNNLSAQCQRTALSRSFSKPSK